LNETISFIAHQLEMANIKLVRDLSPSLSEILGNATLLQQVFTNIVLNSLQAMPRGGELSVSTQMIKEKFQEMIQITFRDTGFGILQENLSRVFDPFFTTKAAWEGTGLGLSVSYGIIKDHKGEITVKSETGKGTTFIITIPVFEYPVDSEPIAKKEGHVEPKINELQAIAKQ